MTGGDLIRARFMRQNSFQYAPTYKLTFLGNYAPDIESLDDAMRRRFNIVPFVHKPAVADLDLTQKLRAEWPGILRWIIEGCLSWQAHGLRRPNAVREATSEYFAEQDIFATWLEERCEVELDNQHKWETSKNLLASWTQFAKSTGEEPGSGRVFRQRMRRHGLRPHPKTVRIEGVPSRVYYGVRLLQHRVDEASQC
jgi:putative DNA primase/helicase